MKLFLVATGRGNLQDMIAAKTTHVLISYIYLEKSPKVIMALLRKLRAQGAEVMIDSGAFTLFFKGGMDRTKLMAFAFRYFNWLIANKDCYDEYVELDVDVDFWTSSVPTPGLVSWKEIDAWNDQLTAKIGRQPISVWHSTRTMDDYKYMLGKYKHVGFSAATDESSILKKRVMADMAHEKGVKVHGFACTRMELMRSVPFDTVDSTTWVINASMFGAFMIYAKGKLSSTMKDGTKIKFKKGYPAKKIKRWSLIQWRRLAEQLEGI